MSSYVSQLRTNMRRRSTGQLALAAVLLVIGGVNWGIYGLLNLDLVQSLAGGEGAPFATIVYSLVGLAALYQMLFLRGIWERWGVAIAKN